MQCASPLAMRSRRGGRAVAFGTNYQVLACANKSGLSHTIYKGGTFGSETEPLSNPMRERLIPTQERH